MSGSLWVHAWFCDAVLCVCVDSTYKFCWIIDCFIDAELLRVLISLATCSISVGKKVITMCIGNSQFGVRSCFDAIFDKLDFLLFFVYCNSISSF